MWDFWWIKLQRDYFLRELRSSSISIIPPMLTASYCIHLTSTLYNPLATDSVVKYSLYSTTRRTTAVCTKTIALLHTVHPENKSNPVIAPHSLRAHQSLGTVIHYYTLVRFTATNCDQQWRHTGV